MYVIAALFSLYDRFILISVTKFLTSKNESPDFFLRIRFRLIKTCVWLGVSVVSVRVTDLGVDGQRWDGMYWWDV